MRDGALVASGTPDEVLTEAMLAEVFELEARVLTDPVSGTPLVVPAACGEWGRQARLWPP